MDKYRIGDIWKYSERDWFIVVDVITQYPKIGVTNAMHDHKKTVYYNQANFKGYHLVESSRVKRILDEYET
jgi:hypothetical protein